jgi:hypothetical protein
MLRVSVVRVLAAFEKIAVSSNAGSNSLPDPAHDGITKLGNVGNIPEDTHLQ